MTGPERLSLPDGNGGWMEVSVARWDGTHWSPVLNAPAPAYPDVPFVADQGPMRNIATNCAVLQNEWKPGPDGGATATRHLLHANAESVTLGYFARPNPGFGAKASSPLRAWVRSGPSEGWRPVTFNGASEVTMNGHADPLTLTPSMAQNFYTDPIPGPWRKGTVMEVLTWGMSSEGTMGAQGVTRGDWDYGNTVGSASTVPTKPMADYSLGSKGARPSAIIAPSSQKSSWAIIGDSNSVNPDMSYALTAFRARSLPHIMNGKHGIGHHHLLNEWWSFQMGEQVKWVDSIYSAMLTNDGNGGGGEAGIMSRLVQVWTKATRDMGMKRWVQALKTPSAARRSDGTLAGTPDITIRVNQWLLDGAPVLNGAPAPTGTTDPAAVRARVARRDGTVKPGAGSHPVGDGWIADSVWMLEEVPDNAVWKKEYDANDVNHYYQAGHDAQAVEVKKLLALMGF